MITLQLAPQSSIIDYANKLNTSDFFVAIDVSSLKNTIVDETCNLNIIGKYNFVDHFNTSTSLVRLKAKQYSFYPICSTIDYNRFFTTNMSKTYACHGIAIVSHRLKQLDYVMAYIDNYGNVICSNRLEIAHRVFRTNDSIVIGCLPNSMHVKYKYLLHRTYAVLDGVFSSIDDYFSYQIMLNELLNYSCINSLEACNNTYKKEIQSLTDEINSNLNKIEQCSKHMEDFKNDIYKARVDANLMGIESSF